MLLSRRIAIGGIAVALNLVFLTVSFLNPVADFALYSMTSLCIALVVCVAGFRTGWIAYATTSLLVFLVLGPLHALPFAVLFGIFPLLKGLLESRLSRRVALVAKILYFSSLLAAGFLLFRTEFETLRMVGTLQRFSEGLSDDAVFLLSGGIALVVLMVYDYALTLMIHTFGDRLRKALRP